MLTFAFHYNIICLASSDEAKSNNEVWLSLVERCVRDAEVAGSNPVASTSYKKVGNTEKIKVSGLFLFLEQACKSVRKVCLRMFVKCVLRFVLKNVLKFGLVISKMAYEKSVHYIEKPIATFTDYRFHSFILNFLFV